MRASEKAGGSGNRGLEPWRHALRDFAEPAAEADRGRHPGFPSFNVIAGGPGSLAER